MRDLKSMIDIIQSIPPAVHSTDQTGTGVDLQGFDSAVAEIMTGADVGSTHAPRLEEGDTLGGSYSTVAAADLQGAFSADIGANAIERVGYIGTKRFIRLFVASSGVSLAYGGNIIRGRAAQTPLA